MLKPELSKPKPLQFQRFHLGAADTLVTLPVGQSAMPRYNHYAPAGAPLMTAPERDAKIVELYGKGWSLRRIARVVGMRSPGSVSRALNRISEGRPGRDPRA
jgi:hypothetical protein